MEEKRTMWCRLFIITPGYYSTSLPANPKDYPNLDYSCFIGHLRGQSGRKIDQHRLRALPKHSVFPSINNYTIFLDVCILRICVFISCFEILESAAEDAMNLADRCAWKLQCFPSPTTAPCSSKTPFFCVFMYTPQQEQSRLRNTVFGYLRRLMPTWEQKNKKGVSL
ncbi:hypothetical protein, no similarity [Geotrichum candidum]|uniref:Uncharacterized protein n=1 Tax=Geotrichum candidum TaxID=1173061 RepID=A0A0J9X486_GEOCN|nr:hypothetical protein, no similarity [Geotrichum candidum]